MNKVTSREYKVMLRPSRFNGDEKTLLHTSKVLWRDFSTSVSDVAVAADGQLDSINMRRLITFYDTRDRLLNRAGYIFRDRRDAISEERDVTLKFRHSDRYVAQNRQMNASPAADAKTKFEEDIKGPFVSLYSASTKVVLGRDTICKGLEDIGRLFPGIADRIAGFRDKTRIAAVNGFTARELVLTGANLQVGKTPKVDAECALIVWYDQDGASTKPVAVELSFRYGNKDEEYGGGATGRAFEIFRLLQSKLTKWVDPRPRTKTAFVYQ
jgi:hypothetical protein